MFCGLLWYGVFAGVAYGLYLYLQKFWMQQKLDRFSKDKCPKDKVILHGTPRSVGVPTASPFVLKLETFLRMTKIDYEYDGDPKNTFGENGKTPWISLNGEHIADSQVCIQFLTKKFNKQIKNNYSEKEKAVASLVKSTVEDRCFWEIFMWAFIWGGERHAAVGRTLAIPWYAVKFLGFQYRNVVWAQGIGRHTRENIAAWTYSDIKSVATVLGNNKFLLGDEPCLEDCTLFGFCGQLFWGFPASSPYSKFAKEEYPNLYAYANRMKDRYFPDWDQLIAKEKSA